MINTDFPWEEFPGGIGFIKQLHSQSNTVFIDECCLWFRSFIYAYAWQLTTFNVLRRLLIWKCNLSIDLPVRLLVGWSVCRALKFPLLAKKLHTTKQEEAEGGSNPFLRNINRILRLPGIKTSSRFVVTDEKFLFIYVPIPYLLKE